MFGKMVPLQSDSQCNVVNFAIPLKLRTKDLRNHCNALYCVVSQRTLLLISSSLRNTFVDAIAKDWPALSAAGLTVCKQGRVVPETKMFALQGKTMWNGQIWVNQTKHLKHQSYWWFSWPHWCASIFNTTVDESWWGFSREALVNDVWFGGTLGEGCLYWWNFNFAPPMRSSRSLFPSRWTPFGKIMSVTICTMQCTYATFSNKSSSCLFNKAPC